MKNLSLLCLVTSLLLSCSRLNNRLDAYVLECGPEAADRNASWVRILSQEGSPLSYEQVQQLDVDFVGSNTAELKPSLSSKGCIKLSSESGLLSVRAPNLVQVFSEVIEPQPLQTVRLQPYPKLEAQLNCPASGLFAHQSINNVWTLKSSGNTAAAAFEIKAVDVISNAAYPLYSKGRGKVLDDFPSQLSTANLPEGIYRIEADYSDPADGWQAAPRLLNRGQECLLTVLHRAPGLPEHPASSKVKINEILPWNPQGRDEIFSCLEEIASLHSGSACQAVGACRETKNFKAESKFAPEKQGVYRGFYFVQDKAGNRSAEACQTLFVSSGAPHLKVLWEKEKWNRDPSVMDRPSPSARAHIYTQHALLSQAEVEDSLECKVDFLVHGQALITGENVSCMSGRCKGMSMKDFVPCDNIIDLSLIETWSQWNVSKSTMRLHVKADDGAGHISETMRTIGINDSRWQVDELAYEKDGQIEEPTAIIPIKGGGFLYFGKKFSFARWREGAWTPIPSLVATPKYVNAYGATDGSAWSVWHDSSVSSQENSSQETVVGRLEEDHWVHFATLKGIFKFLRTDGLTGAYLQSDTQLVHLQPSGPIIMNLPPVDLKPKINDAWSQRGTVPFYDRKRNETYYSTNDQIFVYRGTQWEIVEGFDKPASERYHFALVDAKGRILASITKKGKLPSSDKIIVIDPIKKTSRIHRFRSQGRVPEQASDETQYPTFTLTNFHIFTQDSIGTIRSGHYYWDVDQDLWVDGQTQNRVFPKGQFGDYFTVVSNTTPLWYFRDFDRGTLVHTGKDAIILSKEVLGRDPNWSIDMDLVNEDLYWIGLSTQNGKSSIMRMKKRRSYLANFFPSNVGDSYFDKIWISADGYVSALSDYNTAWKLKNNSWEPRPLIGRENVRVHNAAEMDNGNIVYFTPDGVRLAREGKPPYVLLSDDPDPYTLGGNGVLKDNQGQVWYRSMHFDYRFKVLRVQGEKLQNFSLPLGARPIAGLFFADDMAVVATLNFEFYSKSLTGDDNFVKLDPTRLGLLDFVNKRNPNDFLYVRWLQSGDTVLETCSEPSQEVLVNCSRTGAHHWRKSDHLLQEFSIPWSEYVFEYHNTFYSTPAGELVMARDQQILKLVNGQWEILYDVRWDHSSLSTESKISSLLFDKEGRIWIAMADPFNFIVYDP